MFCRKCGQVIPDTAAFCSECGTRIISEEECAEQKAVLEDKPYLTVQEFIHSEYAVNAKNEYKHARTHCIIACLFPIVRIVVMILLMLGVGEERQGPILLLVVLLDVVVISLNIMALKKQTKGLITTAIALSVTAVYSVFFAVAMKGCLNRIKDEYLTYLHT